VWVTAFQFCELGNVGEEKTEVIGYQKEFVARVFPVASVRIAM
jgi:hypothetical protein